MALSDLLSPTAYIRKQGLKRGLLGGNRGWLVVGGTFWFVRILRRAVDRAPRLIATEILEPGQVLRLEAIPNSSRADRKASRATRSTR